MQVQGTKPANSSLTKVTATTAASNAVSGQSTSEAMTGDSGWQVVLKLAKKKLRVGFQFCHHGAFMFTVSKDGADYRGVQSRTKMGYQCEEWGLGLGLSCIDELRAHIESSLQAEQLRTRVRHIQTQAG